MTNAQKFRQFLGGFGIFMLIVMFFVLFDEDHQIFIHVAGFLGAAAVFVGVLAGVWAAIIKD